MAIFSNSYNLNFRSTRACEAKIIALERAAAARYAHASLWSDKPSSPGNRPQMHIACRTRSLSAQRSAGAPLFACESRYDNARRTAERIVVTEDLGVAGKIRVKISYHHVEGSL